MKRRYDTTDDDSLLTQNAWLKIYAHINHFVWPLSGAFAGFLIFLPIFNFLESRPFPISETNFPLIVILLLDTVGIGALVGRSISRHRGNVNYKRTFTLKTFLFIIISIAPFMAAFLPTSSYHASVAAPFSSTFMVTDATTGQPIMGASVQIIDASFDSDSFHDQGPNTFTDVNGQVKYTIFADVDGNYGVFIRTQRIGYDRRILKIEAAGYRLHLASLANNPSIPPMRLTAPPLNLTFPPPASVTVRLTPISAVAKHMGTH